LQPNIIVFFLGRAKRKITKESPKHKRKHPELLLVHLVAQGSSFKLTPDEGERGGRGGRAILTIMVTMANNVHACCSQ
jgi:hypothetical protein